MDGWIIVGLTILAIGAIYFVVLGSFALLELMNEIYHGPNTGALMLAKILLLLPYIALTLWCVVLQIFIAIFALFTGYQILKGVRDWWHKG